MIVLALITGFTLRWTRFGRYVFAIGGNEKAAILTGVPVRRVKLAVYMISSLSADTIARFERGEELKPRTVAAIRTALESAAVIFIENGDGPGVKLRTKPPKG
jgi:ribose/xylose/arabinose/galactoside ABC-type transport system permease subunit